MRPGRPGEPCPWSPPSPRESVLMAWRRPPTCQGTKPAKTSTSSQGPRTRVVLDAAGLVERTSSRQIRRTERRTTPNRERAGRAGLRSSRRSRGRASGRGPRSDALVGAEDIAARDRTRADLARSHRRARPRARPPCRGSSAPPAPPRRSRLQHRRAQSIELQPTELIQPVRRRPRRRQDRPTNSNPRYACSGYVRS